MYSPIDFDIKQEELVEEIVKASIPGTFTIISKRVAQYGLLERENATILNASLLPFARKTVRGFSTAARALGLSCPFFVTSNDGTLLTLKTAGELPIQTFSSGPTNSMRGASFLARLENPQAKTDTALVVDIGGTTVSAKNGFPLTSLQTEIGVLL